VVHLLDLLEELAIAAPIDLAADVLDHCRLFSGEVSRELDLSAFLLESWTG
jgi:hypothetical protein